jgi:Uma2 family endonuclease
MRTDIKFTTEEYKALPEGPPYYQLIDGDLILSPSPTYNHQTIIARLVHALYSHVESKKLGIVRFAPLDIFLSDIDIVQPDIVYVSDATKSRIEPDGIHGGPDLCIEVLSSKPNLDRKTKRVLYARHGVNEYWIVDPESRTVELFRLQQNAAAPARIFAETEVLVSELFPGLNISLAGIFAS